VLQERTREVMVALKRKMMADWEGLTMGGETVTAAVGNALVRAAVARSSAWMRGGSLGRAQRRAWDRKGEASTAASGGFLKWRWRGRGGGWSPPIARRCGISRHRSGCGAAWHVARAAEQGRGGGADWGLWPQCRAAAPADRWAQAAQCAWFNLV
jgi:hypothetical protein